jgi:uncharacterized protein involved in exopolysaccharide biosynthesis
MMERIVELVFRHKVLLSLPILLGLAGGLFALLGAGDPYYSSRAAIWVERPTDLTGESFTEFNPYTSPAENQASLMRELLGLNSFNEDIIRRVVESDSSGIGVGVAEIRAKTFIYPYGQHVLYVEHHSHSAVRAQLMVSAVVGAYTDLYKSQIRDKAVRAKTFYKEQLDASSAALVKASADVKTHIARNPQLASVDLTNPLSIRDAELARLVAAEQAARDSHDRTERKFADSQIAADTANGTIPNFLVMDEAQVPVAQVKATKRSLLVPPMFGLAAGMFFSAACFLVYWRLDRRVHLPDDLALIAPGIPLMTIPFVTPKRRRWPSRFVRLASALQIGLKPAELSNRWGVAPAGALHQTNGRLYGSE